jgi:SAM-dependent methyltransferase
MRICLSCHARYPSPLERCPDCGFAPPRIDGFPAFAPELAHAGGGFDASFFAVLAGLEESNFWFRSRNQLILWALRTHCGESVGSYLELGCGTGYVLEAIRRQYPQAALTASEVFVSGLACAVRRVPAATLVQMDARSIPFDAEFDVVGAFDVLEHIAEDTVVLQQAWQALKPGGCLVLTVPQHPWLWSKADSYASHVRRYTAAGLHEVVRTAGFDILRSTSFTTLLLPAMMASRLRWRAGADYDPMSEFRISPRVNRALERVLDLERKAIQTGFDFPVGGSRLLVARKKSAREGERAAH